MGYYRKQDEIARKQRERELEIEAKRAQQRQASPSPAPASNRPSGGAYVPPGRRNQPAAADERDSWRSGSRPIGASFGGNRDRRPGGFDRGGERERERDSGWQTARRGAPGGGRDGDSGSWRRGGGPGRGPGSSGSRW